MTETKDPRPNFSVDRETDPPTVHLLCSVCDEPIREIKPHESVSVSKGYYCEKHDDGAIYINPTVQATKK